MQAPQTSIERLRQSGMADADIRTMILGRRGGKSFMQPALARIALARGMRVGLAHAGGVDRVVAVLDGDVR